MCGLVSVLGVATALCDFPIRYKPVHPATTALDMVRSQTLYPTELRALVFNDLRSGLHFVRLPEGCKSFFIITGTILRTRRRTLTIRPSQYGIKAPEGAGLGTGYELYRELKKVFEGE